MSSPKRNARRRRAKAWARQWTLPTGCRWSTTAEFLTMIGAA